MESPFYGKRRGPVDPRLGTRQPDPADAALGENPRTIKSSAPTRVERGLEKKSQDVAASERREASLREQARQNFPANRVAAVDLLFAQSSLPKLLQAIKVNFGMNVEPSDSNQARAQMLGAQLVDDWPSFVQQHPEIRGGEGATDPRTLRISIARNSQITRMGAPLLVHEGLHVLLLAAAHRNRIELDPAMEEDFVTRWTHTLAGSSPPPQRRKRH